MNEGNKLLPMNITNFKVFFPGLPIEIFPLFYSFTKQRCFLYLKSVIILPSELIHDR